MSAGGWWVPLLEFCGTLERSFLLADGSGGSGGVSGAEGPEGWSGATARAYVARRATERRAVEEWANALRAVARAAAVHAQEPAAEPVLRAAVTALSAGTPMSTCRSPRGVGPGEVRDWWESLGDAGQARCEAGADPRLGDTPGLPVAARDRLNRVTLDQDDRAGVADRAVTEALSRPGRTLLAYDPDAHDGDGEVMVGVGDVAGARNLVVLVPGVGSDVGRTRGQSAAVERIVDSAGPGTAGVWWLGYDAPDSPADPAMFDRRRASEGGDELAADLAGLQSERSGVPGARTTVVGHSYGSTVMAQALGDGPDVDAAVFVGSPGAGDADRAGDLAAREVFALRNPRDLVAMLGSEGTITTDGVTRGRLGLGADPATEEFGATRLPAPSERPQRSPWPDVGESHSSYFDDGRVSLRGVGDVVAGRQQGQS